MRRASPLGLIVFLCSCTCREPVDPARAEAPLKKGCEAGGVEACELLGDLYAEPDTRLAGPLLPTRKKACLLGSGAACRKLGALLAEGDYPHRVNVDPSGSTQAYQKGCKLGDGAACFAYGSRVEAGRGASVDLAAAQQAYEQACKLTQSDGCEGAERLRARSKP